MDAVRSVMTCHPDYLVMGMSAITFFGGQKGADDFVAQVRDASGLGISIGSHSCTAALKRLDGGDVDAIVRVGTNLSMIRVAAAAELWLGKPVLAINADTYWHALRANGIVEKREGFGRIFEEF
jgi:hypothetical protein